MTCNVCDIKHPDISHYLKGKSEPERNLLILDQCLYHLCEMDINYKSSEIQRKIDEIIRLRKIEIEKMDELE